MDQDKRTKNQKIKKNDDLGNVEIQDISIDPEADEENNGIGYEILSIKVTDKS